VCMYPDFQGAEDSDLLHLFAGKILP
jgi:hypothetical protein